MELVFVALPVALVIGGAALAAFIWAARDDQFEDLDTPPERALFEELPAVDGAARPGGGGPSAKADSKADSMATSGKACAPRSGEYAGGA